MTHVLQSKICGFRDTAFSLPRSPPVREAFSPVLRHPERRGVQQHTAARHGDIGTPRLLDLLLSVIRVGCNPHSKSARDLMLSTSPCKVFGKEGRST